MAAPVVRLRRSATQSAVPTTAQLALGEVAINTFDGKLFIKKDNGTESIVEIGAGGGGGISNVVEDTTPQLGGDLDLNGNDITGTGNATISTSAGVLSLTASGVGGKVNISGVAGNEIGSGTGTLQAGIFSGKDASAYTQNGSDLTVRGGNAFDALANTNTVQGGHLYLTGGVAGGGGEGVGVANGGSVYIDGGPLAGTGSNGKVLIGTARTTFVGIGTTEPTEELEVSGDIKATSFIKSGGTASQYLMADGSVTSTTVEHKILDDISGSFNGSTTSFTLSSSSTNFINSEITSAARLMISVGGVVQQPDPTQTSGFYISGGTNISTDPIVINFVEAPKAGQDFFGVAYGLTTSPSDAYVTEEQSIVNSIVFGV